MASYAGTIASQLGSRIATVTSAPSLVEVRAIGAAHPRDATAGVFVAIGGERHTGRAFGDSIFKEYDFVVTVIRQRQGDISSNLDVNPSFILGVKQALDMTTMTAVPVVWDVDLVDNPEWENRAFGQGYEMSQLGILVRTNEPRNG